MGLIEKLGLKNKNIIAEQSSSAGKKPDQKTREDQKTAAAQDMCCGSCGGRGHTDRKD
jgi:6-phosphogluconolactonase/glucosamine-6-phosphate isomerase/deaminase